MYCVELLDGIRRVGDYFVGGSLLSKRRGLHLCRRVHESIHFDGHPVSLAMIRSELCVLQSFCFTYMCACAHSTTEVVVENS